MDVHIERLRDALNAAGVGVQVFIKDTSRPQLYPPPNCRIYLISRRRIMTISTPPDSVCAGTMRKVTGERLR